jgi:hypothetical protein
LISTFYYAYSITLFYIQSNQLSSSL